MILPFPETLPPFLAFSASVAMVLVAASLLLTLYRVIVGPTLPDQVVALDLLVVLVITVVAVVAIVTGMTAYLDVAVTLALVGFLGTVAFARYADRSLAERQGLAAAPVEPEPKHD